MKNKLSPVVRLLIEARSLIKRGWCKGPMAMDADGNRVEPHDPNTTKEKEMALRAISLAIRKAQIDAGLATARFWVWHQGAGNGECGWVKLTLRPGQSLSVSDGGPTDEGWHREGTKWTHEGAVVYREWYDEGLDCDGRLDRYGEDACPIEDLDLVDTEGGISVPQWDKVSSCQRDHAAEAMGY